MRYWENADDDPGVWGNEVKLLRRAEEQVQIHLNKLVEIFLAHLG
jgi:hypothetical protein